MSIFVEAEIALDPKAEPDLKDVGSYCCRKFKEQSEELLKEILHEKVAMHTGG